jgi:hypothetical protein
MTLGAYVYNTPIQTIGYGRELGIPDNLTTLGYFHTHLTDLVGSVAGDPYEPSVGDKIFRDGQLLRNPNIYFNIITNPEDGSDTTLVIPFTNWK